MAELGNGGRRPIHVVEDDEPQRQALLTLLQASGYQPVGHQSGEAFLNAVRPDDDGCAIIDVELPGIDGIHVQTSLVGRGILLPVIMMTGHGDIQLAVAAMKAGAEDILAKPCPPAMLLAAVRRALEPHGGFAVQALRAKARLLLAGLTARERDVLDGLLRGESNKAMARQFGISPRTVENHRARMMLHLSARSLSDVMRLAMLANEPNRTP